MKTIFLLSTIILLWAGDSGSVQGQSRWAVSVNVAPTYSHTDYKSILPFSVSPGSPASTSELLSQSHSVGYSFGLMGTYFFSPKWSASAGIWAAQFISTKGDFIIDGDNMSLDYSNKHPFEYAYRLPVLINYQSSDGRLSPYFSVGASADFRTKSYVDVGGAEVAVNIGKAVTVTPMLGVGAIYQLKEHLALVVQPMVQYNVQAHPAYTYYHGYQLSLRAQIMYRF